MKSSKETIQLNFDLFDDFKIIDKNLTNKTDIENAQKYDLEKAETKGKSGKLDNSSKKENVNKKEKKDALNFGVDYTDLLKTPHPSNSTDLTHLISPVKRLRSEKNSFLGDILSCDLNIEKKNIKISKVDKTSFRRPSVTRDDNSLFIDANVMLTDIDKTDFSNMNNSFNLEDNLNKSSMNNNKVIDKLSNINEYSNNGIERKNSIFEMQTSKTNDTSPKEFNLMKEMDSYK